ncbi:hypothetical protein H1C71_028415, partial [Ictidomys tridecemlineatus]
GRRVVAAQQPIAGGAATPHTPLSWKETRHPRPAEPAPPPASARATPPSRPGRAARGTGHKAESPPPHQVSPTRWRAFRKSRDARPSAARRPPPRTRALSPRKASWEL